jgi:hypothetical protein|tara:strand:- start:218 stop:400 length:183 start_codon:yes stop_codon:yes gene_type:complete
MICSNCHKIHSDDSGIDIGKLFNLSKGLATVCSKECKKELKANLKEGFPLKNMPKTAKKG